MAQSNYCPIDISVSLIKVSMTVYNNLQTEVMRTNLGDGLSFSTLIGTFQIDIDLNVPCLVL